jgi:acetyl esterase/lipase
MVALFDFLCTLPLEHHQIFVVGFSGGGYPARLAAVQGAIESQSESPRFTIRGWVSYFGMGGNLLLDYWLFPRDTNNRKLDTANLDTELKTLKQDVESWLDPAAPEISDAPYTESLDGHVPSRKPIWEYLHGFGCLIDLISGEPGLSRVLASVPATERVTALSERHEAVFPQIYTQRQAQNMPPCLLVHGDHDTAVPFEESWTTYKALEDGGGKVELVVIPGANHALQVAGETSLEAYNAFNYTIQWMLRQLK